MIKLFLDTNIIILDVMAQREPFSASANSVLKMGIERKVILCATPLTFANCAYILKKSYKHADSVRIIKAYKQYIYMLFLWTMNSAKKH
jgi:predicted nucleic acid-binding protein